MSKKTSTYDRSSFDSLLPPPPGCEKCRTFVPTFHFYPNESYGEWRQCRHRTYFEKLRNYFEKDRGLRYLGSGSFRASYLSKNGQWVYKIPHDVNGYRDNHYEYRCWLDREFLYARNNLYLGSDTQGGLPRYKELYEKIGHRVGHCRFHQSGVLVMEHMREAAHHGNPIDEFRAHDPTLKTDRAEVLQVLGGADGGQGGLTRDGVFKLYDFTHTTEIEDPILSGMFAL